MDVEINLKHVIENLKNQVAQKAEESAFSAAVAAAAAERVEVIEQQLVDANNEIKSLRSTIDMPMEST